MATVTIEIRAPVFERLQRLATPLVDDINSVVERLIAHWETHPPTAAAPAPLIPEPQFWQFRGTGFTVGLPLRAKYHGQDHDARVVASGIEFQGRVYDSPSAAGMAVKKSVGTKHRAAHTNGWDFWFFQDPQTRSWRSIKALRRF